MHIEIPDSLLQQSQFTEVELRLEIALLLYKRNTFTLGQAAKFAGLHQIEMQRKLKEHNIFLHYDLEMLKNDLKSIDEKRNH